MNETATVNTSNIIAKIADIVLTVKFIDFYNIGHLIKYYVATLPALLNHYY